VGSLSLSESRGSVPEVHLLMAKRTISLID
jgi:hypothetical protein